MFLSGLEGGGAESTARNLCPPAVSRFDDQRAPLESNDRRQARDPPEAAFLNVACCVEKNLSLLALLLRSGVERIVVRTEEVL